MSRQYLRILIALVGFVAMSSVARAEIRGEIVVTVPFGFVAGGKNFPAGTYTVSRFSDDKLDGLILSSYENHVSVVVYSTTVGDAAADTPSVSFNRVGEVRLLSKIETAYDIYTIRVSPVDHATLPELSDDHAKNSGTSNLQ